MKYYEKNGYLDIGKILEIGTPFIFIVGGRGIGKTYGALKYVLQHDVFFMFMRRTQSQTDLINKPEFSPFTPLNRDLSLDVRPRAVSKYNSALIDYVNGEPSDKVRGYTCALSTVSNIRGFDASAVELLIWDEFIPEKHDRPIKNEAAAFFNAYETINRNRELDGRPPLTALCLANANDLGNPIFLELGIVNKATKMQERGQEVSIDKRRGITIILPGASPIGKQKAGTALYNLVSGGEFADMALSNKFASEDDALIESAPLKEFTPLCTVGEITIYKHKNDRRYHVAEHASGSPTTFTAGSADLQRYRKRFYHLWDAYLSNRMTFESKLTIILFERYTYK